MLTCLGVDFGSSYLFPRPVEMRDRIVHIATQPTPITLCETAVLMKKASQKRGRIIWLVPDRFDVKPDKSTWLEMGRCLRDLGWTVTILTGRKGHLSATTETFGGLIQWIRATDLPFVFRISLLRGMAKWLNSNARSDDVVVMNEAALWLVPYLKQIGVRFVHLDFRTLPVETHRWKRRLDRLLFWRITIRRFGNRVDGYSFITERLRAEVEAEFALGTNDYTIWHSGVNLDRFLSLPNGRIPSQDRFHLFYHGSISRKRGLGLVIDAIALGGLPPNFQFVIVGDGPERGDLERQAVSLGVANQVQFRGFVPYERVAEEIAQADVCICPLPDRLEWNVSSPLKVLEYMASGKPMILTPIPAHRDVVGDANYVIWPNGLKAVDFHRAILDAWARHAELAAHAALAPALVRGHYEWHVHAAKLDRYLRRKCEMPSVADVHLRPSGAGADS